MSDQSLNAPLCASCRARSQMRASRSSCPMRITLGCGVLGRFRPLADALGRFWPQKREDQPPFFGEHLLAVTKRHDAFLRTLKIRIFGSRAKSPDQMLRSAPRSWPGGSLPMGFSMLPGQQPALGTIRRASTTGHHDSERALKSPRSGDQLKTAFDPKRTLADAARLASLSVRLLARRSGSGRSLVGSQAALVGSRAVSELRYPLAHQLGLGRDRPATISRPR